jgi:hypothetical protein
MNSVPSENLTAAQATELSRSFLGFAQCIGNYRFANWKNLSPEENGQLADKQWSILNAGEDMLALSTSLLVKEADTTIREIKTITEELDATILKIRKVQKVINISAAIIQLAEVIIGKQPLAIPGAIDGLIKAVK